ncbi:MAG: hypothetical protein HQ453_00960 [Actinobacteria bacterium]|nr:hypothetical protein [Actinomycetota bacterium]
MTSGQALLIFIGIPAAFAVFVALLVFAGSWTRSGRTPAASELGTTGGRLFIQTSGALPDPSRLPREIGASLSSAVGGGAHGTWS